MNSFLRALNAERLKLRKTLAFWLCLLAPILAVIFGTFVAFSGPLLAEPSIDARWHVLIVTIFGIWASFMLPLFVTLESALLAGLEHENSQWKHLMALPLPHGVHYLAKLVAMIVLTVLASLVLALLIPAAGWLLANTAQVPGLVNAQPPLVELATLALYASVGAFCMISFQCFVALRWQSFTVATTFGIVATMIALFIPGRESLALSFIPWKMPGLLMYASSGQVGTIITASVVGFTVLTLLGYLEFNRREWS